MNQTNPDNTVIYVVGHKPFQLPHSGIYRRVWVGAGSAALRQARDFTDASGDNIANRNSTYAELTVLYWMWKNTCHAVSGLCHYRRYFASGASDHARTQILTTDGAAMQLMLDADVVIPKKRCYFPLSVGAHYRMSHVGTDLVAVRGAIEEMAPAYLSSYAAALSAHSLSLFNMCLMRRPALEEYCSWLFPILDHLYDKNLHAGRGGFQTRLYGYLGERLFNVWLRHHARDWRIIEHPVVETEQESQTLRVRRLVRRAFRYYVLQKERGEVK